MMNIREIAERLHVLLDLERNAVGVKLVYSEEEYSQYEGRELIRPLSYCVAVKSASCGHSIKMTRKMGGCFGGNRALGLSVCNPEFRDGTGGYSLGLYESPEAAAKVAASVFICPPDTYGIIVKPLLEFEREPDVVLLITNTREAMRILQGYTYTYGLSKGIAMSGNQAVCVEATVTPLFTKELNVSMFCSGTRYKACWKDSEVITGIPAEKAEGVVRGLTGTINAIEMDERKREIEEGLLALGDSDIEIDYGKTYFKTWKKEEA